jgi:coronin-7
MDFHEDLFPEMFLLDGPVNGDEWLAGSEKVRQKGSLDPAKRKQTTRAESKTVLAIESSAAKPTTEPLKESADTQQKDVTGTTVLDAPAPQSEAAARTTSVSLPPKQLPIPEATISQNYTRKFLTGRTHHPSTHFTSLPQSPTTSSLYRALQATSTHFSFPISGPGGRLALLRMDNPGRHESPPTLSNGSPLVDFAMSPYKAINGKEIPLRIVCASDDGRVTLWVIKDVSEEVTAEKAATLEGVEKVVQVEWHPFVDGLIAVLCIHNGNHEIRLWEPDNVKFRGISIPYAVYAMAWNSDGTRLVVSGGDNAVHVLDPRREDDHQIWVGTHANSSTRAFQPFFCGDLVVSIGFARCGLILQRTNA